MIPQDQENAGENVNPYAAGQGRYDMSYPELCSEFLSSLAKAIKNTALYTLSHPMVIESLRKSCAILGMLFDTRKETSITLSFVNDSWLFNETAVPAVTQESQNLNAFFKAHRLQALTFVDGVQPFEIGALCELLSAQARNRPAGYTEEFFAGKGVTNIHTEPVHYVKDGGYSPQAQAYREPPKTEYPRRYQPDAPIPEIFPELQAQQEGPGPAPRQAPKPAQATSPEQQPRQPQPRPAQAPAQAQRPPAAQPKLSPAPASRQPAPAALKPAQAQLRPQQADAAGTGQAQPQFQVRQPRQTQPGQAPAPAAQRPQADRQKPVLPVKPIEPPETETQDMDSMFGPEPSAKTEAPAAAEPGQLSGASTSDQDTMFGKEAARPAEGGSGKEAEGPGGGKAGEGPGGGKAGEGTGGGKPQESLLAGMSFGGILKGLVESAVKDPKDRVKAYVDAMKMLRETMEQQIAESTRALAAEKEQALNTRTRTEQVLAKTAEGKVIVDKDGKVLMMNPAAEEIAGTKFADAVGKHISEQLRPGEHFLTLSKDMDISGGKIVSGEVEVKGDENMGRTLRRSVALLVDSDGRVVGELSTLPEMTKYKETQRMQEEFLSRVTHDLQSPLSSITSALEMLNDATASKLDPVENKFLDISIRNSHRLSQMIRGILDFSKLQSGKMDVHPVPSALAPIMAEAGEGLMPWAKTKGIKLTVRPVSPELYVMADAPRIVQVLTNLISNAIKATPEGGSVTVAAAPNPANDGGILIGVRDTGHGIPKEDLTKIFEKFVQLSSRQSMEGVGLGLAIVSDFLKLHNGKIWAVSEVGKGSTFYFTLPSAEKEIP